MKQSKVSTTGAYAAFREEAGYPGGSYYPKVQEKTPKVPTCSNCQTPSALSGRCYRCRLLRLKQYTGVIGRNAFNRIHWSKQRSLNE